MGLAYLHTSLKMLAYLHKFKNMNDFFNVPIIIITNSNRLGLLTQFISIAVRFCVIRILW